MESVSLCVCKSKRYVYPKSIPLSGNNAAAVVVVVFVCDAVAAGWKISPKGKRITNNEYIVYWRCWSGNCMLTLTLYLRLSLCTTHQTRCVWDLWPRCASARFTQMPEICKRYKHGNQKQKEIERTENERTTAATANIKSNKSTFFSAKKTVDGVFGIFVSFFRSRCMPSIDLCCPFFNKDACNVCEIFITQFHRHCIAFVSGVCACVCVCRCFLLFQLNFIFDFECVAHHHRNRSTHTHSSYIPYFGSGEHNNS